MPTVQASLSDNKNDNNFRNVFSPAIHFTLTDYIHNRGVDMTENIKFTRNYLFQRTQFVYE